MLSSLQKINRQKQITGWLLLPVICFCAIQGLHAQQQLPVLKSNTRTIEMTIGNDKASWHVDPDTKPGIEPDVFTMDRSFKPIKVTYKSDIDSISYLVKPGDRYNFIILINNRDAYPVGIATANQPIFLNRDMLILVSVLLLIITLVAYNRRKTMRTETLLYLGIIAPISFWLVTIAGGFIHGNYNHLTMVVSELGAVGRRSEAVMSTLEIIVCILSVFSVIGFYKACKEIGISVIPPLTILALSFSMIWAAIFPMGHELHGAIGPIPLIMFVGALLPVFLWRKNALLPLRLYSLLSLVLMLLIMLRTIPAIQNNYPGMIQRFFYLGWTVWSVALSVYLLKLVRAKNGIPGRSSSPTS